MTYLLLALMVACWGDNAYIVTGTVVKIEGEEVVLDHEDIPGLMPAMVMAFPVASPELLEDLKPGHRVVARYELHDRGGRLEKIRITGRGPVPASALGPVPLKPGVALPRHEITAHDGASLVIGEGQARPTALTFIYTRCPLPEFCPAMTARLQALQGMLEAGDDVQLVALSLDPAHDSVEVLAAHAAEVGAGPRLRFARVPGEKLPDLAMYAGMNVLREGDQILHGLRLLVLDAEGRLVERYDDARFPADRVLTQLRTGEPRAPEGHSGTRTPAPSEAGSSQPSQPSQPR